MLTDINIANALATVVAEVDGSFVTQNNAIFATGYSTGAAVVNLGTAQTVIDGFAASGSIAYDTANNHFYAADGAYFTFAQSSVNATVALVAQGNVGGTLDLNGAGLSFTPDVGDGSLGLVATKDGATFSVSLDGTGTITLGTAGVPVITIPKDFSLNFNMTSYNGTSASGNIYGDGVNDVYATLVNGTQIMLASNGTVGANLNLGGLVALNNVTLSGAIVLDPLTNTLTFAQGSTLGVDLGTRHIDITATDNAGGQLTFGTSGLTFKSAGGDGGLILSVTEGGQTRQASLNVVGEVIYSLDGSITLGAGTTVTNTWESGAELVIASNTDGGGVVHLTDGGLQITTTDPEAITATFNNSNVNLPLSNIKLTGTATYDSGGIILSEGSTLTGINEALGISMTVTASSADTTLHLGNTMPYLVVSTAGQCIVATTDDRVYIVSHGSRTSNPFRVLQISAGTDSLTNTADTVVLTDVGLYAVNGTLITNNVAGSTFVSNPDGSIIYNGVTYAAGEFTIDAEGNGIGLVASADLAGDFLPNYDNDFATALALTDADTNIFDTQLTDLVSDTPRLGEIDFDTQPEKLDNLQIVFARQNKLKTEIN